MKVPKISKLEFQVMDVLWRQGALSIREILEAFPEKGRLAYPTIQTVVYRLEAKKAVHRVKKISNAHIFEAVISREIAQRSLMDEFLNLFSGSMAPVMVHLVEKGKLTLADLRATEKHLQSLAAKRTRK